MTLPVLTDLHGHHDPTPSLNPSPRATAGFASPVDLKGLCEGGPPEALGQHQLEHVAGLDVLPDLLHSRAKLGLAHVAGGGSHGRLGQAEAHLHTAVYEEWWVRLTALELWLGSVHWCSGWFHGVWPVAGVVRLRVHERWAVGTEVLHRAA